MSTSSSHPGRRLGYGLAVLVAVVGLTTAATWGFTSVLDQVQRPGEFVRADISSSLTLTVTQLGPHVIYYEGDDPTAVSADELEVVDATGSTVAVRPYGLDLRYDVPGRPGLVGTAIGVFDADRIGSFVIGRSTGTSSTVHKAQAQLAVGDDLAPAVLRAIVLPALAGLLSVIAAIALATRTWSREEGRSQP